MLVTSAGHEVIIMEDVEWQDDRYLRHFAQETVVDSGRITLWDITALNFCTNPSSLKGVEVGELLKNVQGDGELRISLVHVFGESCCLAENVNNSAIRKPLLICELIFFSETTTLAAFAEVGVGVI
jgi:hypothetical protein